MSAVVYQDALNEVLGQALESRSARECVNELRKQVEVANADTPTLRRVWEARDPELVTQTQGAFVLDVIRSAPGALPTFLRLVCPKATRKTSLRLHADCLLVLSNWVTSWNRRQIRRVA